MDHSIEIIADKYISWIKGWIKIAENDSSRFHFVKFEDLKIDTVSTFKKILHFYGIQLSEAKINKIVKLSEGRAGYSKNIESSKVLPFGVSSNFRSGRIGDWKKDMHSRQIKRCKELLGDILIELGYEKNNNW